MQIYIHVGLHRTGSTFLQKKIFPKLESENSNFIFNPISLIKILNEEYIKPLTNLKKIDFCEIKKKIEFEIQKLKEQYKKEKNLKIMISNESLIPDNFFYKNKLDLFSPLINLNDIFNKPIILIFIRERESLTRSIYNQHFKTGYYKNFNEFLNGFEEPNIDINKINFSLLFKTFSKNNPHHIWIFKFEKFNQNVLKMIKLLNLDSTINLKSLKKLNQSISDLTIKRTLKINKLFKVTIFERKLKENLNRLIFKDVDKIKLRNYKQSNYNIFIFLILKILNKIFILLRDNFNLVNFVSSLTKNIYNTKNYKTEKKQILIDLSDKNYNNLDDFIELKNH